MPRRSSRPSGGRRPAPRARAPARAPARSASTSSRPAPMRAASKPPATQKPGGAQPPVAAKPPQKGSAMGGFMSNVASTGLGVMAGRALDRTFFGGSGAAAAPAGEAPAPVPEGSYEFAAAEGAEPVPDSVCAREALEFKKCMQRTGSNVGECQWNFDLLSSCQRQQHDLGFAEAGRF